MNPRRLLLFALLTGLASCMQDGPSTETGNPSISGDLRDMQGNPAAGKVKLFRPSADTTGLVPPTLLETVLATADGRFRFDSLPSGSYVLEGAGTDGKTYSLAPDLDLADAKTALKRVLILKRPALFKGTVTRGPNARPPGVIRDEDILVRIAGTDRFGYSDTAGRYAIANVPEGIFRVSFSASGSEYEPRFLDSIRAVSGGTLELPLVELPWSRYAAPPAPTGLVLEADSAAGIVRLRWQAVKLANLAGYRVFRHVVPDGAKDTVFDLGDTAFGDTAGSLPPGIRVRYGVRAVNALGNIGPETMAEMGIWTGPPLIALPPDSQPPVIDTNGSETGDSALSIIGMVLDEGSPAVGARIRLFKAPSAPGIPFLEPLHAALRDTAQADASGRFRFRDLPAGLYTLEAIASGAGAKKAMLTRIDPGAAPLGYVTLDLAVPGTVKGSATRDGYWTTIPEKGNGNVRVLLAGTPYTGLTGFTNASDSGPFSLEGIPPGAYKMVVWASPDSLFLADTLDVRVESGSVLEVPLIHCAYNPDGPPLKIATLALTSPTRARISLTWTAPPETYPLRGYRVARLDEAGREISVSGILAAAAFSEDISAIPSGTVLRYVVRIVDGKGREGPNGGTYGGLPVTYTIP